MRKQLCSTIFVFLIDFFLFCSISQAQPQPAPSTPLAPTTAPSAPTNITAILEKAGQFTTFIKLLKSTQEDAQIDTQINNSNQGLTVFAPTDNAFTNLKAGTLNSLTDQEKVQLVQFHILPNYISTSQFQTISNPLRTQAGNSANGEFPLNVTTSGNQVNLTTGVNSATVSNTISSAGSLAVYQVDQVLLPLDLFKPPTTAPAPAPTVDEKVIPAKSPKASSGASDDTPADASSAAKLMVTSFGAAFFAAAISFKL